MANPRKAQVIYVVGAGLSAGLGYPTIGDLLPKMWDRIENAGLADDHPSAVRFPEGCKIQGERKYQRRKQFHLRH